MSKPCHPPPPGPFPSAADVSSPLSTSDPYRTLGLDHEATPAQIKAAYRKLALRYHPDRQLPPSSMAALGTSTDAARKEATDKFATIAAAYAVLSDPARKREYDHLYKYGAFDEDDDRERINGKHGTAPSSASNNNYRYTEDFSGGYYKKGYIPPTAAQAPPSGCRSAAAAAAAFQSMQSQDSFFDDLIYSPKSAPQNNQSTFATGGGGNADEDKKGGEASSQRKRQPGIGFSFAPLGKHLSVHVPSRHEVMLNVARPDVPRGAHLFGTRVTFSQQSTASIGPGALRRLAEAPCGGGRGKEKVVVCQTTRIAKGRRRIVKRTAHLHPDGKKEVVIEENGIVRRRYVEENAVNEDDGRRSQQRRDDRETSQRKERTKTDGDEGGLQKEDGFTLMGLFKSCLAPCSSIAS